MSRVAVVTDSTASLPTEVAQGITSTSEEKITYTGTAGYYSWRVESYSGSGSYTFGLDRP